MKASDKLKHDRGRSDADKILAVETAPSVPRVTIIEDFLKSPNKKSNSSSPAAKSPGTQGNGVRKARKKD